MSLYHALKSFLACRAILMAGFHMFISTCIYSCSTVQYSTVQYSTVQYSTVQYSTVQFMYMYIYMYMY